MPDDLAGDDAALEADKVRMGQWAVLFGHFYEALRDCGLSDVARDQIVIDWAWTQWVADDDES